MFVWLVGRGGMFRLHFLAYRCASYERTTYIQHTKCLEFDNGKRQQFRRCLTALDMPATDIRG